MVRYDNLNGNTSSVLQLLPYLILILVIIGLPQVWGVRRGDRIVAKWAKDNGYRDLRRTYINPRDKGKRKQSRDLSIYRVEVVDVGGAKKAGTVLVGLLSRQVEHVTWDDKG